ncbi:MAG: hypothetical protein M3Y27_23810 [Acidobacteriota bacterium]|nr:hypothetical protein [Acidobacteriota bacterium]
MKNAHERLGWLEFHKRLKDTTTRVRLPLDRFIGETPDDKSSRQAGHLISVLGSDVDVGAIWAAIVSQEPVTVCGPELPARTVILGKDATTHRGSIALAGQKRNVRHLVAVSAQMANDSDCGRMILWDDNPEFVLYRLAAGLGLPVHPSWATWFRTVLARENRIQQLEGLGCRPLAITGNKNEFLEWIGHGLRLGQIKIPDESSPISWPRFRPAWEAVASSPSIPKRDSAE